MNITTKWLLLVVLFSLIHIAAMVGCLLYVLEYHYDQPTTPIDPLLYTLAPLCLLGRPDNPGAGISVLLMNSFIWGIALSTAVAWWAGWLPKQFSLRTLLIVTTLVAVALGFMVWMMLRVRKQ